MKLGLLALALVLGCTDPHDLARGARVTVSSRSPATKADPQSLVDGHHARAFAFHTKDEESPWVVIDLGAVQTLSRVVVHNRGDGWLDANLPLALELSEDGAAFTELARRFALFEPGEPWVVDVGRRARAVRLRVTRRSALALAGVEVYGDP